MPAYLTLGQPGALAGVRTAVERGDPPQSLLLVGPARVGKTTLALDLAAGLLCLAGVARDRPCSVCAACRKVAHGNHPDLHRLAPQGSGEQVRLGQVQALVSELALLPLEGRHRIALVEAGHRLNPDAQNALLKTIEEPPAGACIVLAADDESTILPTVRSRCTRLRLGPVSAAVIQELLERRGLGDAARAAALARLSGGRPGVALALAGDPEAMLVHARITRSLLDLLDSDRRTRLAALAGLTADAARLDDARRGEGASAVGVSAPAATAEPSDASGPGTPVGVDADPEKTTRSRGAPPAERRRGALALIGLWREVARDLAVAAAGGRRELRHVDLLEELVAAAGQLDRAQPVAFLERLDALAAAVESYANPELVLDVLALEWPRLGRAA